ncbi:MAG: hypothetical protein M3Q55_10275 [Acidobacteriota bacterium]|nr:hypothetical protein [Acidobacteriota bacterium]
MKRMLKVIAALLLTVGIAAQGAADKAAAQYDGKWLVTTINGGSPADMAGGDMVLIFGGGKYQQLIGDVLSEEGAIAFDATKTPHHIDLTIGTGPDGGKLQRGVLEVKGDIMALSLSMPDADPARTTTLTEGPLVVVAQKIK